MEKVIATIVIIVLTMGLISYAIVGQMSGFRDTADVVTEEESRLDTMLKDSTVVPLSTVKNYINKSSSAGYSIVVDGEEVEKADDLTIYNENTLFTMSKTYDEYGKITVVSFTLKNQSFAQAGWFNSESQAEDIYLILPDFFIGEEIDIYDGEIYGIRFVGIYIFLHGINRYFFFYVYDG